ncbi:alkaline phosphatase [Rhodococcus sp. 06-1477-1B]|nr:alkaline phosphatase [Rhodococcus sp. 06-1477-1B]
MMSLTLSAPVHLTTASIIPDAASILHAFGPWVLAGLALIIFIESGVLFPFLPGDSLLVTAAVLAGPLGIQPWQVLLVGIPAAILGDQTGYWLGRRFGRHLFKKDARVLKPERLHDAEHFFHKYGGASLVLGRFVPVVRTYVPVAAGTAHMHYPRFALWNTAGAALWVTAMTGIGLALGGIPFVVDNIDALMLVVVVVSILPIVIAVTRKWSSNRRMKRKPSPAGEVEK